MSSPDSSNPTSAPRQASSLPADALPRAPGQVPVPALPPFHLPPILTAGPTVGGLLHGFLRAWWLAVLVGIALAGVAGAILWVIFPSKYVAEIVVSLNRPPRVLFTNSEIDPLELPRKEAAMIRSPLILNLALRQPELADLPDFRAQVDGVAWLEKMILVETKAGQSTVRVTASADDPTTAAAAVNAVVVAYIQENVLRRQAYLQSLKDSFRKAEESLRKKREALVGLEDPRLSDLERNYQVAQFDLKKAEAEMAVLKEREKVLDKIPASESAIEEYIRKDDQIASLYKDVSKIGKDITEIAKLSRLGMRDPMVTQKLREKEEIERKVEERRKELTPFVEQQARDKAVEDNRVAISRMQERIAASQGLLKSIETEGRKLPGFGRGSDTPEMKAIKDDINAKLEIQRTVAHEIQIVEMEGKTINWINPLGRAETPTQKVRDRQLKMAGIGAGGFLALGILGVSWLEWRTRKVTSTVELTQGLAIPLVGTVPSLPARARRAAVTGSATSQRDQFWQGRLTEAVDALRTLLLRSANDSCKVVMVTSALGGEGKTSLAAQLAVSMARAWRKTLLIDGDVRQPAAHQVFNLPLEPGLCEVLRGEMEAGDAIQTTSVGRLWLMAAGHWDAHAIQALAQEGSRSFFDQLRDQYDIIIVDSSPVLPVADALVLGQHVDSVLLAVRCGNSRLPAVYAANHRLQMMGIPVLGAVAIAGTGEINGLEISYPRSARR